MQTLSQIRKAVAPFVGDSGVCEDDPRVLEAVNEVRDILYELGDWKNTVDGLCVHPYRGIITLPPKYSHAKKAYTCNSGNMVTVNNEWFVELSGDWDDYCGDPVVITQHPGVYVTFRDWPCVPKKECCPPEGFYVKVVPESDKDCGTEIIFHGQAVKQREFSLTRVLGKAWKPILGQPGEIPMAALNLVVKPITHGRIRVYGYDHANEILLAVYEPQDINPQYTRYAVRCGLHTVVIKAKKRFKELTGDPNQFVDIHTQALIHGLQGVTDRLNRNLPGYNAGISMATGYLNKELAGPQSTCTYPIRMSKAYRVEGLI